MNSILTKELAGKVVSNTIIITGKDKDEMWGCEIKAIPVPCIFRMPRIKPGMKSLVRDVLSGMLIRAYKMLDSSFPFTKEYNVRAIRYEIGEGRQHHNNSVQTAYLRKTRSWWEETYTLKKLCWFQDFMYLIPELEEILGKPFGNEWFNLYGEIKGELPKDFPKEVAFVELIENVLQCKFNKITTEYIGTYFDEHPEGLKLLQQGKVPSDIPVDYEVGLTLELYVRAAKRASHLG